MRREGLDIDLMTYIERRDAGAVGLPDPYLENIGRVIAPRPVYPAYPVPGAYPPPYPGQGYAPQPYAQQAYAPPPYAQPAYAPPPAAPPYTAYTPPVPPAPVTPAAAPPRADDGDQTPAPNRWTAPGAPADQIDPESPWS
jgi:hypothetical protein